MINRNFLSKIFILVMAFVAVLGLSACGKEQAGKEVWDKFVDAVNSKNVTEIAKTLYYSEKDINKFTADDGEGKAFLSKVSSINTKSYETTIVCDFTNELTTDIYYEATVVAEVNDKEEEFKIYSAEGSRGLFLCSLPTYNESGKFGNTPSTAWYQKGYFTTDAYRYQVVVGKEGTENTIAISQQNKNTKEVVIPAEIDGLKVTKISSYAFYKYNKVISFTTKASKMKYIELPNTIETIGKYAFYQCGKLLEIELPESVKTVEPYAFSSCVNLKDLKVSINDSGIYEGLKEIESSIKYADASDGDIIITGGRELYAGDILTLSAKSKDGKTITQDRISWSANSDIVSISTDASNNAVIIANKTGAVTITATYKDDPSVKATLSLNIQVVPTAKSIDCTSFDRCSDLESLVITAINPNSIVITGDGTSFSLNGTVKIYVPKGSVDMYKNHAAWAKYANQIQEIQ